MIELPRLQQLAEAKKEEPREPDYPRQAVTPENVLAVLPASQADIFYQLGRDEDYSDNEKRTALRKMLEKMEKEGKVYSRSRTADDPVYYKK